MVHGFPFRPIQLWLNGAPLVALFSGGFVFETGSVQPFLQRTLSTLFNQSLNNVQTHTLTD
jgi:hypothetical protein